MSGGWGSLIVILEGGAGNDYLNGGAGSDSYRFARGWGQDTIMAYDTSPGRLDAIEFDAGIAASDIVVSRSDVGHMTLGLKGSSDRITVNYQFGFGEVMRGYRIDQIRFADGTAWNTAQIETLAKVASGPLIRGTPGNDTLNGTPGSDTLEGLAGNDTLDAGAAEDVMSGGAGNDMYVVDTAGDVVIDLANEGIDTIASSVSWTLGQNLEHLWLSGRDNINATGNELANVLTANAGDNVLDGASGTDTASYHYSAAAVTVSLAATGAQVTGGSGTDTLLNIERLLGSSHNDTLTGNASSNMLTGGAGNDTLDGGAGNDTLIGGAGNDTYRMARGQGRDTIIEDDATAGNKDVVQFASGITADQLWFRQVGNNLEVSIIGTEDKLTLNSWYAGSGYQVEEFRTSDGHVLIDTQVQNLVQAMASFVPPAAGQTTLPQAYQNNLAPLLAADWR
ncbi:calcium-binding protein [Variovorax sp. WS11]|uniref:calcium-binding protein n=1 Tax=Variovorax sp. WS11 TaxID=1105204 RepID=UPI0013DC7C8B|nr:calcium-binding protein [Variovorax sp. WS11]NDZ16100.1 calcium-binding protein [Variovorax sp. WS11]